MRRISFALLLISAVTFLASSLLFLAANSFAQSNAGIRGSVMDASTGLPISGVKVTLAVGKEPLPTRRPPPVQDLRDGIFVVSTWYDASGNKVPPPPQPVPRVTYTQSTDAGGNFAFNNVDFGDYRLRAEADGYFTQDYVSAGEKVPVSFRLTAGAVVSGSVTDPEKRPVANFPVYLLRATSTAGSERRFRAEQETTTDDAGHYKFASTKAGRYYIAAGRSPTLESLMRAAYGITYYPGGSEAAAAASIDLTAGTPIEMDNLVVHRLEFRQVRGRLIDTRTGQPPVAASVVLIHDFPFDRPGHFPTETRGGSYDPIDGSFRFTGLTDGSHRIGVTLPDPQHPRGQAIFLLPQTYDAYFDFDLVGSDRDDLVVRFP